MTSPSPNEGLRVAAVVSVALWALSALALGLATLLAEASFRFETHMAVAVSGVLVYSLGLNVLLPALVLGIVVIIQSRQRPILRSLLLLCVLAVGAVTPFFLLGFTNSDDEDAVPTHRLMRAVGICLVAIAAFAGSAWLLRGPSAAGTDARPWWRGWLLLASAAGAVLLAGAVALGYVAGKPAVRVHNDTSGDLSVQLCPAQECSGPDQLVRQGDSTTVHLQDPEDPLTPDSLRVFAGTRLVGCFLVPRDEDYSGRTLLDLSDADPDIC